jgi:tripartite-type tricarboxylate transporter receptor subunit TctC
MKLLVKLGLAALLALPHQAYAQSDYPSEPLRIIVPTDAGGSVDALARIFQREIDEMGVYPSVVVVNQPGAGGTVGTRAVRDAAPDGHTIGIWSPGIITSKAMGVVDYDHTAFTVLGGTGLTEIGMGVLKGSRFETPGQLIEESKAEPNSVVVATNIGLPVHFIPMMFADAADIEMKFVQIGGGAKRLASILGGHTDIALFSVSEFKRYEESGLKPLFLFSEERDADLDDVPTAKESGVDLSISVFRVWLAPEGLEPEVQAKLEEVLSGVLAQEDVQAELQGMSIDPAWISAEEVERRLDDMNARTEPLVAAARAMAQ